ncbi:hypothetical protein PCE1_001806 [Barthelona sp. PCE]
MQSTLDVLTTGYKPDIQDTSQGMEPVPSINQRSRTSQNRFSNIPPKKQRTDNQDEDKTEKKEQTCEAAKVFIRACASGYSDSLMKDDVGYFVDVGISGSDEFKRVMLRAPALKSLMTISSTRITIRGRIGDSTNPLTARISSKDEDTLRRARHFFGILQNENVLDMGEVEMKRFSSQAFSMKRVLHFENVKGSFSMRHKLLGMNGVNFKHIRDLSGAKLSIDDSTIEITATNATQLEEAERLTTLLLNTTKEALKQHQTQHKLVTLRERRREALRMKTPGFSFLK